MRKSIIVLTTSFLFVAQAKAIHLGKVETAGNACDTVVGTHDLIEVSEGHYMIPSGLYVKKDEDKRVVRGVCSFALTLQASAGKKIIVSNARQRVSLRAYPSQTKARMDLEIFEAGSRGETQTLEAQAVDRVAKVNDSIGQQDAVIETGCGASTILRGHLSGTLIGAGKAIAYARNLHVDIHEVECQ